MRRSFSELAEVAGRADKSSSEVMHPESIREHSTKQRIFAAREIAGEREASTTGWQRSVLDWKLDRLPRRRSDRQHRGSDGVFGLPMITAMKDGRDRRLSVLLGQ